MTNEVKWLLVMLATLIFMADGLRIAQTIKEKRK